MNTSFVDYPPCRAMLMNTDIMQTDVLVSMLLADVAIVFITRNLTRPVNILHESVKALHRGHLGTRAPVVY